MSELHAPPEIPPPQDPVPPPAPPHQPPIGDPVPAPLPPGQPPLGDPQPAPSPAPPGPPPIHEPPAQPPDVQPPAPINEPPPLQMQAAQIGQQQMQAQPNHWTTASAPVAPTAQPVARYGVIHQTDYSYQSLVTLSQQYLHLTPRNFAHQQTVSHQIQVDPAPEDACGTYDYFANSTRKLTVTVPHQTLIVRAESVVEVFARPTLPQLAISAPWEEVQAAMRQPHGAADLDPYQYLYNSPHIQCNAALRDYALASFTPGRPLFDAAFDLTCRITDDFEFDPDATNIHTTLDEVMEGRRGVCQDFAHLMIGCLRAIGLPSRYVSGYILTHPPEGQARLIGADASHAWASLWSPESGWVDFDPTNRCLVQHEHITLGWGRDYSDVTPLRGIVLGGGTQLLGVSVTVTPITQGQNTLV